MTGRSTDERGRPLEAFLSEAGWARARRRPLAGDASGRRFLRLSDGRGRSAVLMEAPPPREDVRPFVRIARHLAGLGLSTPRIYALDEASGLVLLEDFGDSSFARLLDAGAPARPLYELAVDVLIELHRHPAAATVDCPAFDDAALAVQPDLFVEWYLPAVAGGPIAPALRTTHRALWRDLVPLARGIPDSLVLRDYFPANLMSLRDRPGVAACGLLDFQDALIGSRAYDLASLLEDARRDVPDGLAAAMVARYLAAFPALDPAAFHDAYALCAALRNCRILGVFARLARRDGKAEYLRHVPRVWRSIERQLAHPALAPLAAWLAAHVPPAQRRVPSVAP